jgi:hypothetical protein
MDESHLIYVKVWAEGEAPVEAATTLAAFDAMDASFLLQATRASYGATAGFERPKDRRQWLKERLEERDAIDAQHGDTPQISMWGVSRKQMVWALETDTLAGTSGCEPRLHDPSLLLMVDVSLAREDDHVARFTRDLARIALSDARIWFGLIDPTPRPLVPHPRFYSGSLFNGPDWEHLVEQAYWRHDALGTRDRVRGIYWGNIYGAAFAKRIREAGYAERMKALEEYPIPGVREGQSGATTIEGPHGGMAVLLDDNPRWFAKTRQRRMYSLERAVMTAAALKSTLSRAGLL